MSQDAVNRFSLVCQRLYNQPLAVRPDKAEMISFALSERLGLTHVARQFASSVFDDESNFDEPDQNLRRGYDIANEIAIIPVCGTLVQKTGSLRPWCGMLGYDSVRVNVATAVIDKKVKGILLDCDSPGGEVSGCFDLVDYLVEARQYKPIRAAVNEMACSAAYAIASAAERITIARTGIAGSIGVIAMHTDISQALAKDGIKVTFIYDGANKANGAPEMPLSDAAFKDVKDKVLKTGKIFKTTVARNRGLSFEDVRSQEASVYMGEDAIAAGLADEVMPIDQAFAAFRSDLKE